MQHYITSVFNEITTLYSPMHIPVQKKLNGVLFNLGSVVVWMSVRNCWPLHEFN